MDADGVATPHRSTVVLPAGVFLTDQDFGYRGESSIGDIVFFDYLGDGGPFDAAQDHGLGNVQVTLETDVNGDRVVDYTQTVVTDADGLYSFEYLIPGTYTVIVEPSDLPDDLGDNPTYDADGVGTPHRSSLMVGVNDQRTDQDFGYHATPDYAISKDDGRLVVSPGDTTTYTITVSNVGTLRGQNVLVTDNYPIDVLTMCERIVAESLIARPGRSSGILRRLAWARRSRSR